MREDIIAQRAGSSDDPLFFADAVSPIGEPKGAGSRWALMQTYKFGRDTTLVRRTRIIQTPLFGVYLHKHYRPDADSDLHNHPWNFVSVILSGAYIEEWAPSEAAVFAVGGIKSRFWRRWSVHRIRVGEFHRITTLSTNPTWTLLLIGLRQCDWGYATSAGFVDHKTYHTRGLI